MLIHRVSHFILLLTISSSLSSQTYSNKVKSFISISDPIFAINHVTIIDGTGKEPQSDMTVVIKNGKISNVDKDNHISIAKDVRTIDGTGHTLLPGFVMMHEHMYYARPWEDGFNVVNMTNTFPRMYLAGGVTTLRTGGCVDPYADLNIKKMIKEGKMIGPKMDLTTPYIERENELDVPQMPILDDNQSAGPMVDYWSGQGFSSVKAYMDLSIQDLKDVLQHAHTRNMKVTGHLCSITYHEAASLGIDNLEHGFMVCTDFIPDRVAGKCDYVAGSKSILSLDKDSPAMDSLMDYLIQKKVSVTTTLPVFAPQKGYEFILGGGEKALHPDILAAARSFAETTPAYDSIENVLFEKEIYWIHKFYDKGGKLMVGTDPTGAGRTIAGYSNIWSLETLIKKGFTPSQAVNLCTLRGAEYLNKQFETGSIEKGKAADLIFLKGDLTTRPESIRDIEYVFKDGIGFNSKAIFESVKGKVGIY